MILGIPAAVAFKSTINDMSLYLKHKMGMIDNPLKEAIDLTHTYQSIKAHKMANMGLSWFIEEKKWSKYPLIHHRGTTMGFHTYFGFIKEEQIGIVMFSTIQLTTFRMKDYKPNSSARSVSRSNSCGCDHIHSRYVECSNHVSISLS
ncbi:serine hydrolase [Litchfieldia alkalitelluris]|uniref:serine hydrolase n=1 Tax=Litchfieldia alkalitelluris TaxID=304268 RepID=UPI0009969A0E|nr:serine hydrolase [Litchfieldia alkalitelluris]